MSRGQPTRGGLSVLGLGESQLLITIKSSVLRNVTQGIGRDLVNTVVNRRVPYEAENFLVT
jgi:hypothetical protein